MIIMHTWQEFDKLSCTVVHHTYSTPVHIMIEKNNAVLGGMCL